jgi:S-methyl-5-thioribose-1-phosphate isomerase
MIRTIYFEAGAVYILDQNKLPTEVYYEKITDHLEMARAIKLLKVRGAPLIGVAAAFGLVLAVQNYQGSDDNFSGYFEEAGQLLASTRPTAVNLFWALSRMKTVFAGEINRDPKNLAARLLQEAQNMCAEDINTNMAIGKAGQELLGSGSRVLTICNAGALATCGYGTALGVIRSAYQQGKVKQVWACETRPVLQGARLTVWELMQDRIPVALITDSMAASLMKNSRVDAVIAGADRIAANGDTANKIGTYSLAVLARYHKIPFYIAAPLTTMDLNTATGQAIPIEERSQEEVRQIGGRYITVPEVEVFNPAFDVTPAELINAIITEAGVVFSPYGDNLKQLGKDMNKHAVSAGA